MKTLTKKAKAAVIGSVAGLAALALGVGLWQPWKQPAPADPVEPPRQTEPAPQPPEEKGPTLAVGGEEIPCTIFEGDGWSIWVPEGWEILEKGEDYLHLTSARRDASIIVGTPLEENFAVSFRSLSRWGNDGADTEGKTARAFYSAGYEPHGWEIWCHAETDAWEDYDKLMTAVARTFSDGEIQTFADATLAHEPAWQEVEGKTVLWLDKDGYVVDDGMEKTAAEEFSSWGVERQSEFTGRYRLAPIRWAGSYVGLTGDFVDVFESQPWYEVAPGCEPLLAGGAVLEDGWWSNLGIRLDLAVIHDGEEVIDAIPLWCQEDRAGDAWFAFEMLRKRDRAADLTAEELLSLANWFNQREHNGMLRFETDPSKCQGLPESLEPYLVRLFYDLGERDFNGRELELFREKTDAGEWQDLDRSRLSRAYIADYLGRHYGFDADMTDHLLAMAEMAGQEPGCYVEEFDAWYMNHGDTEMRRYVFDHGYAAKNGDWVVYYTNDYVSTDDGRNIVLDAPMRLRVRPSLWEPGGWAVVSNVVLPDGRRTALLHEEKLSLPEGGELRVCLYGREPLVEVGSADMASYGVGQVVIQREYEVTQYLSIAEVIREEAGNLAITGGYTQSPTADGGLELRDLDGDGDTDLALLEFLPAHNKPMLCWLWDSESGTFRYGGCVLDPEPGAEPGQVVGRSQDHAGAVRYIETYEADETGRLRLVKRVTEDYRENQKTPVVTEETFPAAGN